MSRREAGADRRFAHVLAELDENMRRHKEAQRLRKKRVELEKKKQQRLMAEGGARDASQEH